jgi:acetyl esterase/lipase
MMGGRVVIEAGPIQQTREKFVGIFAGIAPFIPPPTDAVRAEDVQLTPTQRVRIFTPAGETDALPVGLYIHSGGWFTGSVEGEDFLCRIIAEKSKMILFSPDYRLAPEDPYPAGLEDVCAAYEFMNAKATQYGGDSKRKFIMGGSAGGSLAACVALKYSSSQELRPAGLVSACLASCDPRALPSGYKSRYTPELYSDSPMIGNAIMSQARGKRQRSARVQS